MMTAENSTSGMRFKHFATQIQYSVIALVLMSVSPFRALAQGGHSHAPMQHGEMSADSAGSQNALLQQVRQATVRFKDVSVAEGEGYALQFGCVSGDTALGCLIDRVDFITTDGTIYTWSSWAGVTGGRFSLSPRRAATIRIRRCCKCC